MLRNLLPNSLLAQFRHFPCGTIFRTAPVLQAESDETPLSCAATFGDGGCRAVPQIGFGLGLFVYKITLPEPSFGGFSPIFRLFFA